MSEAGGDWRDHPCLETTNVKKPDGYGRTFVMRYGKRVRTTHQLAWIDAHGRWPEPGKQINHYCDNPPCMEVTHLWEGTQAENNQDAALKGRTAGQKKTHCKQGHEFGAENTYVNPKGHRFCRTCRRDSWRRYYSRKKGGAGVARVYQREAA